MCCKCGLREKLQGTDASKSAKSETGWGRNPKEPPPHTITIEIT